MRAAAEVDEVALAVKRDDGVGRQVADDLALVGFAERFEQTNRFLTCHFAAFNRKVGTRQLAHPFIDLREMNGFTVDMALEEIRFARAHPNDFARIAVLTEDQWVSWSAWLSQIFLNADVRVFNDADDAEAWLAGTESPAA